jgi:hypothetical protein
MQKKAMEDISLHRPCKSKKVPEANQGQPEKGCLFFIHNQQVPS